MAVSELVSNFVNKDLKENLLFVLPESECHSNYLGTIETWPMGFIKHKTVVILGEVPVRCGVVSG